MVKILRKHTNAVFRVDANCSWTAEQVIKYASDLKSSGVEFIEQPLPRDSLTDMVKILDLSTLPIVADESCCTEEDIERCKGCFHGVNIKLAKCVGLTPALRMIHNARNSGSKVIVGCMVEGTICISAIAHLLPLLDYVDMDGSILIRKDTDTADGDNR